MRLLQLQLASSLAIATFAVGCSDSADTDADGSTPISFSDSSVLPGVDGSTLPGFDGSITGFDGSITFPGLDSGNGSLGDAGVGDATTGGDAGDGGPVVGATCSGKPGKLRGKSRGTVSVGGTMRSFRLLRADER